MEAAHAPAPHSPAHDSHDDHGHEHHELGFIRTYILSTDHKTIGIQYILAGLVFMFFGFSLMMLMRWQLAFPGTPLTYANLAAETNYQAHIVGYHLGLGYMPEAPAVIPADPKNPPLLEIICGKEQMPGGVMTPDFYNTLGAMHGTIMVFFAIVPIGFAAFHRHGLPAPEHGLGHPLFHQRRHHDAELHGAGRGGQVRMVFLHPTCVPGGPAAERRHLQP
jgi:cytochrome c oxidase subunit 1